MFKILLFIYSISLYAGIYGTDDRVDAVYTARSIQVLGQSVAALIPNKYIENYDRYYFRINSPSLSQQELPYNELLSTGMGSNKTEYYPVCPEERFSHQPSASSCTGFMVSQDVVMTAGHCLLNNVCNTHSWVFGYKLRSYQDSQIFIKKSDVYRCKKVLMSNELMTNPNNTWMSQDEVARDFAMVQLDRPIIGRSTLAFSKRRVNLSGDTLFSIGHPVGLPQKVTGPAQVFQNSVGENSFVTNLDSYHGSSGAPVFSHKNPGMVIGMMVMGKTDFQLKKVEIAKSYDLIQGRSCFQSKRYSDYSLKKLTSDVGERVYRIDKMFTAF